MVRVVKSLSYRKAGIGFGRRIDSSAEESIFRPRAQIPALRYDKAFNTRTILIILQKSIIKKGL